MNFTRERLQQIRHDVPGMNEIRIRAAFMQLVDGRFVADAEALREALMKYLDTEVVRLYRESQEAQP